MAVASCRFLTEKTSTRKAVDFVTELECTQLSTIIYHVTYGVCKTFEERNHSSLPFGGKPWTITFFITR